MFFKFFQTAGDDQNNRDGENEPKTELITPIKRHQKKHKKGQIRKIEKKASGASEQEQDSLLRFSPHNNDQKPPSYLSQSRTGVKSGTESEAGISVFGTHRYSDGSYYEGEYINGIKKHGFGRYTYKDGSYYEGEWKDGKISGEGLYMSKDGTYCYRGAWKDGQKHGIGLLLKKGESVYKGDFVQNMKNGTGTESLYEGGTYTGEFRDNFRHGKGRFDYLEGGYYEGDWANGVKQGTGKRVYIDDGYYEGDFLNGKAHGRGKFFYPNGGVYEGEWENGDFKGEGVRTFSTRCYVKGRFNRTEGTEESQRLYKENEKFICGICGLEGNKRDKNAAFLGCEHFFHYSCIKIRFGHYGEECPTCGHKGGVIFPGGLF